MADRPMNLALSLEELDGVVWGEADPDATWMVKMIHALRRKPLAQLTDEEVRLAVRQCVGEPFSTELAIHRVERDPLCDGGCYPGDILSALIRNTTERVWQDRPDLQARLKEVYAGAAMRRDEESEAFRESLGLPEGRSIQ